MAGGRPQGGADDGAVLDGRKCIACELASPPPRPFYVCTPHPPACAFPIAADSTHELNRFVACVPQAPRSSRA
eukprot:6508079-Prymnesium_polylepis.1